MSPLRDFLMWASVSWTMCETHCLPLMQVRPLWINSRDAFSHLVLHADSHRRKFGSPSNYISHTWSNVHLGFHSILFFKWAKKHMFICMLCQKNKSHIVKQECNQGVWTAFCSVNFRQIFFLMCYKRKGNHQLLRWFHTHFWGYCSTYPLTS